MNVALAAMMLLAGAGVEAKKLHTIGDSTMDGYAGQGSDKLGWGAPLQQFMNGLDTDKKGITVNNRGKSGASTRTFYTDSRFWATMVTGGSDAMQAGDILLIQFAHNDENNKGVDAVELQKYNEEHGLAAITDLRGTNPTTTYKENLKKYIDEAKAMGVKPILVSAMCRNYWTGTTIRANGRHNLKDGYSVLTESGLVENQKLTTDDHSMDYTYQMEQVAIEKGVPYINMTEATAKMFEDLGQTYCNANIFNVGDGTHTGPMGATLIARCFATALLAAAEAETRVDCKALLDELAQYVSLNSDIALSPETMDFGSTYVSTPVVKTFNIAGFDLAPTAGTYTISATEGYEVSLDGETYAASISPAYEGGNIFASVKVRGTCAVDGKMDGTLRVSCGSIEKTASLTMTGILNTSGEESQVLWSMADGNATAEKKGELIAGEEVISGLVVGSPTYQEIDGVKYRRYKTAEAWPDQMDEVSDRYIQFSAEVPDGKNFRLDKIELDVVAVATNYMRCRIYYATKADFTDAVQVKEFTSMASNAVNHVSVMPMLNLTKGDKVYVRVYPWMQGASASGKYIALKDVTIHGYTEDIPTTEEVTAVWNSTLVTNKTSNDTTLTSSVGLVLTVVNNGTSASDYVNNVANDFLHWNGTSKTTARYAKFTAPSDGHIVVTYQSNNSTAKDRIVAVAKSIVLGSDSAALAPDENVFGCGYTDGYTEKTISVDVTAGDVYVYNANSGCRVNSISFTYTREIVSPDPGSEPSIYPLTATWDFTALTDLHIEGKEGTVNSDVEDVVLSVDATGGKLKYNGSNSAQFNAGTIIKVPVTSKTDVVTVKGYPGYFSGIQVGGEAMATQEVEHTATAMEAKDGYVVVTATTNSYLLYIKVLQNGGDKPAFTETHAIYCWDAKNLNPTTMSSVAIQSKTGSVTSSVKNVTMGDAEMPETLELYVDASVGKFAYRDNNGNHDIQMNDKTIFRVPVISTDDEVTIVCRSNASGLYVHGDVAPTTAIKATFGDKTQGYMEFSAVGKSVYLSSIQVMQVKKPAAPEPELAAVKVCGQTFGAEIFKGVSEGQFAAEVRVASSSVLPTTAAEVEVIVEQGEAGTITFNAVDANTTVVTIPVTYEALTNTYTLTIIRKTPYAVSYYDVDGTTLITTQYVDDGEKLTAYVEAAKDGVTMGGHDWFRGWFDGTEISSLQVPLDSVITSPIALYARVGDAIQFVNHLYVATPNDGDLLMAAIKALKKGDRIFLPNGTYSFGKVALTNIAVDSVSLIGESMEGVLVKNYPDVEGIGTTATILLTGKDCYFQDLTLQCYAKATASAGRGVALQDKGTNNIFKNVFLQGTQDTYYSNGPQGMKAYFENGRIEGTVDFICGSGTVYFKDMQIGVVSRSSANVICAPNTKAGEQFGYVFEGCTVDAAADQVGKYNLCRPWNDSPAATWINTTLLQTGSAAGYTKMTDGLKLRFHEFGTVDANGAAVTGHNLDECKGSAESESLYLDAASAAAYSYANVLGAWNPAVDATQVTLEYSNDTWTGATDAAAFLVNGEIVTVLPTAPAETDVIRAANARGGFGPKATINAPTAIEKTEASAKATKMMVNGQVVILKNGVQYNLLGTRL